MHPVVAELMTKVELTLGERASLAEAWTLLRSGTVHHLCVTDSNGELLGVVSDRDVRRALASPGLRQLDTPSPRLLDVVPVTRIAKRELFVTSPHAPLREAIRTMLEHRISALPVLDHGGLVGLLTDADMTRYLAQLLDEWDAAATWLGQALPLTQDAAA